VTQGAARVRVALYTPTLPPRVGKAGGVEVAAHRLAQALARRGRVEVTCLGCRDVPPDALYRHDPRLGALNRSMLARNLLGPLLLNVMDLSAYDVIHFNGDDAFFLGRNLPAIRTFHGTALHEARSATTLKRRAYMQVCYRLERLSARLRTCRIAVGSDARRAFAAQHVIGNIVEAERFVPRTKFDHPAVCFIGLWGGRKRGQFMVETFLRDVLPAHPDAILYMIADHAPAHPAIRHLPALDDDALALYLARCWVFACPSRYEGFGIPYVEAMAAGTMVIASPNTGACDQLGPDDTFGQIRDDAAFGPAITAALFDIALRADHADRGRRRAADFTADTIAARYEALYLATTRQQRRPARPYP
jgi:phosphatidylinositol alpha-mannosyltransferase